MPASSGWTGRRRCQALITTSINPVVLYNNQLAVARTARGLLATQAATGIACTGSPVPSAVGFQSLVAAGTRFASTRLTEGFASAFEARSAGTDAGTRVMVRYSGIPAEARLFVPDVIAGSDAETPTAGGDLGGAASGGQYAPSGAGSLLLSRVRFTDSSGAGGQLLYVPGAPGSGAVSLDSVSELTAAGGNAMAVYEVVDANPLVRENAQFPTFVGMPEVTAAAVIGWTVSLAPVSDESTASPTAPVPRFVEAEPPSDCPAVGDCSASYFPQLEVLAQPLHLTATAGGSPQDQPGYITVRNAGGGLLNWTAGVTYKSGTGWLALDATAGVNNRPIRVTPLAQQLMPGTYEAVVTIDAGPLDGLVNVPVVLSVVAAPAIPPGPPETPGPGPAPPAFTVIGIVNAADFVFHALAPGEQAVVMGSNLSGGSVAVTFDGIAARLLSADGSQIKLIVPAELEARPSALMVVTVDGVSSAPSVVTLAPFAPAVFRPGILNADGSLNGPVGGAAPGSEVVVLTTGLAGAGSGTVTVKIHDRDGLVPAFVGPLEGADGVQQVRVAIPDGLPAMTADVFVCAPGADGQRVCSHPAPITIGR